MDKIELDCRKLLGFKIVADGGSTLRLSSPKIGDKTCPVVTSELSVAVVASGSLRAKVGVKGD
jgi:hypothetical protein